MGGQDQARAQLWGGYRGAFDPFGGHKIVRIQNSVTPICLNFQNSVTPIKDQPTRFKWLD